MTAERKIELNFHVYPLVVGQEDKFTFYGMEKEGGSILLRAKVRDEVYTEADVRWYSENAQIAVVDNGRVQAIRTGITDIHAVLPDRTEDVCRIQVIDNIARLTVAHAALNTDYLVLNKGEGAALYPQVLPVDYYDNGMLDTTFAWSCSDESVAVVDHRGRIWGRQCGHAVITGASMDVGRTVSCEVEVVEKEPYTEPLEDYDGGVYTAALQEQVQLVLPEAVRTEPVRWRPENPGMAAVDETGLVTVYHSGTIVIWATFVNGGRRVRFTVQAEEAPVPPVRRIVLSRTEMLLAAGESKKVYAVVFPASLLEKQLVWSSSDEQVIRIRGQHINLSGLDEVTVEGVSGGTAVLSGSCEGMTVYCSVEVTAQPALQREMLAWELKIPQSRKMEPGEVAALLPDGLPPKLADAKLLWTSEKPEVASVDGEGILQAHQCGETTIYAFAAADLSEKERPEVQNIPGERACAQCAVHVEADCLCLTNLHVPVEAVSHDRATLLWNSASTYDFPNLKGYEIYIDGTPAGETSAISYTLRGLSPKTCYTVAVAAVAEEAGRRRVLCRREVTVTTKAAPETVLDVTQAPYFAVGDGIAYDTPAIQRAVDDCPEGGVVLLPKGKVFYSGALFLKGNMTFQVDGILLGSTNPEDYPPVVCRWEGYRKLTLTEENRAKTNPVFKENNYSHCSLLNVGVYDEGEAGRCSPYTTENVCICGEGMINGSSFTLSYNEGPCWFTQRKGLPVPQSPVRDQNIRGRAVAFYNVRRAYMYDVTVAYSPSWTIQPVFSDQMTFDNVKVISMGNGRTGATEGMLVLNGDGIDPDSSTRINIVNSFFTVGDDAVAIKSGRNSEGNELAKPSAYIRVTDCVCVDAKGSFCIGSESAGGVHDVLFQNLYVENPLHFGLWIKSAPSRGGLVENVIFRDCILKDTGGALQIEYNHGGSEYPAKELPDTRHVLIEHIRFEGKHKFGIRLIGHPQRPISDVTLRGLEFADDFLAKKARKFVIADCKNIKFEDAALPDGYEWEA